MNGNEMLKKLGRLSEITSMKDVRQLTTAMFPGTHCPLMGAAMAVRGIQDAYMLLVGTDECAYYTKHMTLYSQDFGGVDGRCLSVVLDAQNVTFGCAAKMEEAFDELVREYHPKAVFLVTTCIPELIGDDMDAIAGGLSMAFGCGLRAPHGGIFVLPVVSNPFGYLAAIMIGSVVGALLLAVLKKPVHE